MLRCLIIFAIVSAVPVFGGYAGSSDNNVNQAQQSSSGTSYGYSGSYSGGVPPNFAFPQIPQFDFSRLISGYLDSFNKYQQDFINKVANPQNFQGGYGQPGGFPAATGFGSGYGSGSSFGGSFSDVSGGVGGGGGSPAGGASASASIGPQGVHQAAGVYPENPNSPNIDINSRFGGPSGPSTGGGGGGGPGQYSVFTSSVSHSSNLNGKPQSFHQASTTVNDNGKVTTYTVKNP